MTIYFYSTIDDYGCFSNFSKHGIAVEGVYWPTVEHFFQAQKFEEGDYQIRILKTRSPKEAARLGRSRSRPIRNDWDDVKVEIMHYAVYLKFATHASTRDILLSTGDAEIVENAPGDYFWGCGANGSGKNMLGKILMKERGMLRSV